MQFLINLYKGLANDPYSHEGTLAALYDLIWAEYNRIR